MYAHPPILRILGQPVCQNENRDYDETKEGAMKAELLAVHPLGSRLEIMNDMNGWSDGRKTSIMGSHGSHGMFWMLWIHVGCGRAPWPTTMAPSSTLSGSGTCRIVVSSLHQFTISRTYWRLPQDGANIRCKYTYVHVCTVCICLNTSLYIPYISIHVLSLDILQCDKS